MGLFEVDSITTTDLSTTIDETIITSKDTSINTQRVEWDKWHGAYREIPELQAVIDKVAFWTAGKGVIAKDKSKQKQLDNIRGCGKDTIRDIVINLIRTATICGNGFAEPIWNKRGELINLKPLSPGSIEWDSNEKGIITEYRQYQYKHNSGRTEKVILAKWEPEEIFHIMWNRIADETSGISTIEKLTKIILNRKESQDIIQMIFRRLLFPVRMIEVDTDRPEKLAELKAKYQNQINKGEIMLVPLGTAKMTTEQLQALIKDSMEWILYLQKYFVMSEGVPEVILGSISSRDTEGASKILMLAYEQVIRNKQDWFEQQFKAQLGIEIDLPDPPTINPLILTDIRKSGALNASRGNNSMTGLDSINPAGENK